MSSTIGILGSFIVWYFCKCWFKRFSAYDLLANDVDFNVKLRNVIFSSTNKDNIAVNEQVELFSGGFKLRGQERDSYVSFGMYQNLIFKLYAEGYGNFGYRRQ
jgi:hypothetical protein